MKSFEMESYIVLSLPRLWVAKESLIAIIKNDLPSYHSNEV